MAIGERRKSPRNHGGLVTSPPVSSVTALRKLESAYARQGEALDKANAEVEKLKARVKELERRQKEKQQ